VYVYKFEYTSFTNVGGTEKKQQLGTVTIIR